MSGYPEGLSGSDFCHMEGHIWNGGGSCVRCGAPLRCGCGQFVTEAGFNDHLKNMTEADARKPFCLTMSDDD
jgi:hypothetical protein